MSTTKKVIKLTLTLNNGKSSTLTVNAAPINDDLTDPDGGADLLAPAMNIVAAAYESDDGGTISSYSASIVTTTTIDLAQDQVPTP